MIFHIPKASCRVYIRLRFVHQKHWYGPAKKHVHNLLLTFQAAISKNKFSRLISSHFLKGLGLRIWQEIRAFPFSFGDHFINSDKGTSINYELKLLWENSCWSLFRLISPYVISIHIKLWVAINNPMCQLSATSSSKHDTRRVKPTSMKKTTQFGGLTHQWFVISSKGFWATNSWFYTSFSNNWYTIACTIYMGTEYIPVKIKKRKCKLVANLSITAKKIHGYWV